MPIANAPLGLTPPERIEIVLYIHQAWGIGAPIGIGAHIQLILLEKAGTNGIYDRRYNRAVVDLNVQKTMQE